MKKFEFRLEKVLDYRQMVEGWAKTAYLEARAKRLAAETERTLIEDHRRNLLRQPVQGLGEHLALERSLLKLDDDERAQDVIVNVLAEEEVRAMGDWIEAKRDLEAIVKLRAKAYEAWRYGEEREEQRQLDDFAVARYAAA